MSDQPKGEPARLQRIRQMEATGYGRMFDREDVRYVLDKVTAKDAEVQRLTAQLAEKDIAIAEAQNTSAQYRNLYDLTYAERDAARATVAEQAREIARLKAIAVQAYEMARGNWSAQCFCFTSAPESMRRAAHEVGRDGWLEIYTLLGPTARPEINAEYGLADECATLQKRADAAEASLARLSEAHETLRRGADAFRLLYTDIVDVVNFGTLSVRHGHPAMYQLLETRKGQFAALWHELQEAALAASSPQEPTP